MLRYHPSLEFEPSPTPSQSTVVVLYNPEALKIPERAPSGWVDAKASSTHAGRNTLKSLLDLARLTNECKRAGPDLEVFLRQLQDEQAQVEAALERQTAVRPPSSLLTANLLTKD